MTDMFAFVVELSNRDHSHLFFLSMPLFNLSTLFFFFKVALVLWCHSYTVLMILLQIMEIPFLLRSRNHSFIRKKYIDSHLHYLTLATLYFIVKGDVPATPHSSFCVLPMDVIGYCLKTLDWYSF